MSTGSALPGEEWVTGGLLKLLVLSTGHHMAVVMMIVLIIIITTTWCGHLASLSVYRTNGAVAIIFPV